MHALLKNMLGRNADSDWIVAIAGRKAAVRLGLKACQQLLPPYKVAVELRNSTADILDLMQARCTGLGSGISRPGSHRADGHGPCSQSEQQLLSRAQHPG